MQMPMHSSGSKFAKLRGLVVLSLLSGWSPPARGQEQLDKLEVAEDTTNQVLGRELDLCDSFAIVGHPGDDSGGADAGAAYLFDLSSGLQTFKLTAPSPSAGDQFGSRVAVSERFAVVASYLNDDGGTNAGKVYVFDSSTGAFLSEIDPPGMPHDFFGSTLAIQGSTAAISASGHSPGHVYLYDLPTITLLRVLVASDAGPYDGFGTGVAIDGGLVLVGAPLDDHQFVPNVGSAYVFDLETGMQLRKLIGGDGEAGDSLGFSVGLSGSLAVLGAPNDDRGSTRGRPTSST